MFIVATVTASLALRLARLGLPPVNVKGVFFEDADGTAMREQGWHDLLNWLGRALAG